jgi:hypothetical protein
MPDDDPLKTNLTAPAEPVSAQARASTDAGPGRAAPSPESVLPGDAPSRRNPGSLFGDAAFNTHLS